MGKTEINGPEIAANLEEIKSTNKLNFRISFFVKIISVICGLAILLNNDFKKVDSFLMIFLENWKIFLGIFLNLGPSIFLEEIANLNIKTKIDKILKKLSPKEN